MRFTNIAVCEKAAEIAETHKMYAKTLDDERKKITQPLNDAKRRVDDLFMPAIKANQACVDEIRKKIAEFHREQEALRDAAIEQAAVNPAAMALVSQASTQAPAGTQLRSQLKWTVVDPSLVPREFLSVDAAKVQAVVNEHRESTQIPGIHVYLDKTVAITG